MTTNIAGVISVVFFYIIILVVGIWAGKKKKVNPDSELEESEEVMLAGRNIGMFVGIFTMTGDLISSSSHAMLSLKERRDTIHNVVLMFIRSFE